MSILARLLPGLGRADANEGPGTLSFSGFMVKLWSLVQPFESKARPRTPTDSGVHGA